MFILHLKKQRCIQQIYHKMLEATNELAKKFNVNLETFQSSAEEIKISEDIKFDIIYCGNLLHHVILKRLF